jgi:hypothetical protein
LHSKRERLLNSVYGFARYIPISGIQQRKART